jgi:hypothetical protein
MFFLKKKWAKKMNKTERHKNTMPLPSEMLSFLESSEANAIMHNLR